MRTLLRLVAALIGCVLLLVVALASPVIYVETMCRGHGEPAPAAPLSSELRPEFRTLLTYPEWHIVHAYDDYAELIRTRDPHDFNYLGAIGGYWSILCRLTRESATLGTVDLDTKQLVYVIGVSFTFEMAMKGLYEETLGRATTWLRGTSRAPLDDLSATHAANYARFLQQTPWYRYDFRADAQELRRAATSALRDRERALALGLEHTVRAAYAVAISEAVAATGADDLTLQMVVSGVPREDLEAVDGVRILRSVGDGIEVETPRYRALTHILANWAARGGTFVDIAGNDQILFTALSADREAEGAMASLPRQGYRDTRHLFLVPVADLAMILRGLSRRGLVLEHIHDY